MGGRKGSVRGKWSLLCECHFVVPSGGLRVFEVTTWIHSPQAVLSFRLGLIAMREGVWTPTQFLRELLIPPAGNLNIRTQRTCLVKENPALYFMHPNLASPSCLKATNQCFINLLIPRKLLPEQYRILPYDAHFLAQICEGKTRMSIIHG